MRVLPSQESEGDAAQVSPVSKWKGVSSNIVQKVRLEKLLGLSLEEWRAQLPKVNTDQVLGDGAREPNRRLAYDSNYWHGL